jgi:hypothetical protein
MDHAGTIVSCVGVVFLLVALAGSQTGLLPGDTVTSLIFNAIGGALASVGAGLDGVWAFVVLNGIWAILSSFNLSRVLAKSSRRSSIQKGQEIVPSGSREPAPAFVLNAPAAVPMHWEGYHRPGTGTVHRPDLHLGHIHSTPAYFVAARV